jgi:hypothetical protein
MRLIARTSRVARARLPERGERGRRTVYAGQREADVVMTSMFMANSTCAHQVRLLPGRVQGSAAVG